MIGPWWVLGLVWASFQDQSLLTLDEALSIAEKNAFSVRIRQSEIEVAKAQVKIAEAQLLPGAQVLGTSTFLNSQNSSEFGQSGSLTTSSLQFQVNKIIDISGIYRNRILAARYSKLATDSAFKSEINSLRGLVKSKYFSVLQTQELVLIQERALESAKERLDKARIREQEGAIPRFDVLRLEVEVKQAEQALTDAKGNAQVAKQDLNNTLGRPIETDYDVEARPAVNDADQEALVYVAAALRSRPEVEQAQLGIKALEETRIAEGKAGAPSLNIGASFTKNIDPSFGQADQSTAASLTFTFPITIGGVVAANARTAKEREEQAKIQLEQLQLGIALEVQSALTQLRTAVETYETAVKNEELSTETLRLAQLRYDEGVGILLDVTTSQADLDSARANVAIAAYRVRSAYANLQRAVGRDDLKDLQTELEKKN